MSRITAILTGTVLVPLAALLLLAAEAHRFLTVPVAPPQATIVAIPSGTGFNQAARMLEREGIVTSARKLRILALWQGNATRVKAGRYLFEGEAAPQQVLDRLVAGDILQERLTIQVAEALMQHVQPLSVGVVIRCRHMCMESRGIRAPGEETITSALLGRVQRQARGRLFAVTTRLLSSRFSGTASRCWNR